MAVSVDNIGKNSLSIEAVYLKKQECESIEKEIEELFAEYREENEIEAIALTSTNGIPIANDMETKEQHESFSTLSATILGASEVIFSSFEKDDPGHVVIDSDGTVLVIQPVREDTVLSVMGSEEKDKVLNYASELSSEVEEIRELGS